jgi:hypothetical protein
MNVKSLKITHWVFTGLLCAMLTLSVVMYLTDTENVMNMMEAMGFPRWLVYHITFAKAAGIVFLLYRKKPILTEWAYAGLTFNFCLAISTHAYNGDGEGGGAIMALTLLMASYGTRKMLMAKS